MKELKITAATEREFTEKLYSSKVEILSGVWKGKVASVQRVNFDQRLIGIYPCLDEDMTWFRFENCKIVEK